jgi:Ca2+-binding EF-hand superfamily protein
MFDKAQVMEFKDAFSIMDTNSDGLVDINDLKVTFERLGKIKRTERYGLTLTHDIRPTCHY